MDKKMTPKQIRQSLNKTQEEMGKELKMTREHYQKLETDSSLFRKTKIDVAVTLAKLANIDLDDINFFY